MKQACYFAPRSEKWVLSFLSRSIVVRLRDGGLSEAQKQALLRLLFGLQRFPRITPGLNLHIEWRDMETSCVLRLTDEALSIERAHTRLQYFVGAHHFISLCEQPSGAERQHHLENWLPLFDGIQEPDTAFSVNDFSTGDGIDIPPVNEQWESPLRVIYFDPEQT